MKNPYRPTCLQTVQKYKSRRLVVRLRLQNLGSEFEYILCTILLLLELNIYIKALKLLDYSLPNLNSPISTA